MSTCEIIRILTVRQQHHLDIHSLLQHQVYASQGSLYAGSVSVIDYCDIVGKLPDEADLFHSQRSSAGSHNICNAQLMHRQDIQISLHQDTFVLTGNLVLGEIYSVQRPALHIYLGLLGIHIFRDSLVRLERAASERDHTAAHGMYREHHPVMEGIHHPAVIILLAQTGIQEIFLLVSCGTGCLCKGSAHYRSPSKTIFPDGGIVKSTASEILIANGLSFRSGQTVHKELSRILRHQQQAFVALTLCDVLCSLFRLDHLDIILLCKVTQSLHVRHALMLHHETYRRTRLAAAEAFEYSFGRRHHERRCLLIVKRTTCLVGGSCPFKSHEVTYHILDLSQIQYPVYRFLRNHCYLSIFS